jgi:hypothetical protein
VADLSFKKRLEKVYAGCEYRMVNAKKIYLGSIRIEHIEDQDIVFVLNILPRAKAKNIYQNWERWDYVPWTINSTTETFQEDGKLYRDWNLTVVPYDKVAEIMIYDKANNRFQIMLNGVLMLPINYPLTAVNPTGEIPMAQGKLEPINDFASSKTKIDQEVLDETTKLMIEAIRQTRKPPMGNTSKRVYSGSVYLAGKITNDIREGELFPLIPPTPLSAPEFSFYKLMKENINEKTVNETYSGGDMSGNQTATEVVQKKEQQMLKLAYAFDSLVTLEHR